MTTLADALRKVREGSTTPPPPPVEEKDTLDGVLPEEREGVPFAEVFGWEPERPLNITVLEGRPDVPAIDHSYMFPKKETEMLMRAIELGMKARLVGQPGTGKTELVKQVCARTGRSFGRINFNIAMEPEDLFGCVEVVDGATKFLEGDFVNWFREGYTILFDEMHRAPASFAMTMQRVFEDGGHLHLTAKRDGDNLIAPHPHTVMLAADNTKGLGDEMDSFGSAQIQDVSTINRWEVCIEMDYLSLEEEKTLITHYAPAIPADIRDKLATTSRLLKQAYKEKQVELPFSPRNLKTVCRLTVETGNPVTALAFSYANSLPAAQKSAVDKLVCDTVGFASMYGRIV